MDRAQRKQQFADLIQRYQNYKANNLLGDTSEETIRTWLNEMLRIFGWEVQDTTQILQEKVLSKEEKAKLKDIGSTNTRPDYTFMIGNQKLTFLDAKGIHINLETDPKAAFQIKSYGWSIVAPCAFISNFEQLAIYNCGYVPKETQPANFGRIFLKIDDYLENFDLIDAHLLKSNIYAGKLAEIYKTKDIPGVEYLTPDLDFANSLSEFRILLATNILAKNNAKFKTDNALLSYVVQVIVNRILFIRICEARKLEREGLLLSFSDTGFWAAFKSSSYSDFYEHYDGPMFERIKPLEHLKIDDTVFSGLLNVLYHPSPYRFDVIPTKLLSDIYEIFLAEKLTINQNTVSVQLKPEYIKSKGAVSTPRYIVKDIIERTIVRSAISSKGIANLLSFKMLDIACGSGVFLIELFDYLESILIEIQTTAPEADYDDFFVEAGGKTLLNITGKKAIIENCIFGLDIDPEAVEVAKMSLALKIIDNDPHPQISGQLGLLGKQILSGVGQNIRCGNSLVDTAVLTLYPDILSDDEEQYKTKPFDWKTDDRFGPIFSQKGGFDFIVGNPPYVEIKNFIDELPYMHRYINDTYASGSNGKLDLAIPFIERSLNVLNATGRLGFIVQKRFFKTDYGSKIRGLITENKYLASVTDFKSNSIFKGKITYVSTLVFEKSGKESFFYHLVESEEESIPESLRDLEVPEISGAQHYELPANAIDETIWSFDSPALILIKRKLAQLGKFGDVAKIKGGPQALKNAAYHIRSQTIEHGIIKGASNWESDVQLEMAACRPLICNEHFYPFCPETTSVYAIFPYDIIDGKKKDIPFDEFTNRFPLAAQYLLSQKARLEGPRGEAGGVETMPVKHPDRYDQNYWHLYTRPNNLSHTYPKVLFPMTALDTIATVTQSDVIYPDNANVFFAQIPNVSDTKLYALAGIINSTVFSVLARTIANPQSNGYYKFNQQFMKPVPFPAQSFLDNHNLIQEVAQKAQAIASTQDQFRAASEAKRATLKGVLKLYWEQLDEFVSKLYDLTEDETAFFKDQGRNFDRVEFLSQWA